ncbi:MAG TPA: aminotransferase class I/II-fold pyridoxal phosphate-dependent enzyme [Acidobacteriota bacterium]|nr:aminotransferase class I/II-fold pyridoxal phosphate-dependent enzyme [Acidobacteriota bacterium]
MKDLKSRPDTVARNVRNIPRSGIRDFFDIVSSMPDTISLGVGEPGFLTPWHIRDAAMFALEHGATSYTSNLGLQKLREGLSDYVERYFHVRYDPEDQILVTTGVSEGLDLAIRAIVDPGDEVLYHEPCYVSYGPVIRLSHGVPVAVETSPETQFQVTADLLRKKLTPRTRALVLNFPNNPTGAVIERGELEKIADLVIENDLLIISDEIYAELTYEGEHTSIASLPEMQERTLFLHGFSKAWAMTGFRLGYCCGPSRLIAAMTTIHQYTMLCAPTLSQVAGIEALKDPENDVERMRSEYRRHRNFVVHSFEEMGLPCVTPRGAFYAFPHVSNLGLTSKQFALRLLEEERVAVVPGEAFGPCGSGFVRCSYATGFEDLKEAMKRMKRFVQRLR